ncbi:MAG: beta-ketoacyl-ACP synthase II [Desulfobacterales bacterium]|nr:beta-ketoacyl-ACP synthase II [Desulfobacterales bacterium]
MNCRVVITGVALVTPLGIGTEENWEALCRGKSGIAEITRFDAKDFETKIAGEVKGFRPDDFLPKKEAKRMDLFIAYAVAGARMALEDSGLRIDASNSARVGVVTGCGLGGLGTLESYHKLLIKHGPKKISPFFIPSVIGNMAPGQISIQLGAKGPNSSVATACAAGNHAIGDSAEIIRRGGAEAMISGGVEALITPLGMAGFNAMRALSTRNHEPENASRPFDRDRDGFVMAEGCGMVVLESLEHALERGAKIYAEIIGYGMSSDAYHMAAPAPEGEGAVRCMRAALADAGIGPENVDYINAHGTSTELNDIFETAAVKTVFGKKARSIPISSTKSVTGHMLGGAGGAETIFTALTIKNGIIPPTINLDNPDPKCDLDYVPNAARRQNVDIAMTNSFGFGGTNATLILKK